MDDKIELNRKMNETLEAMSRAIFKSWFVDFDPIPGLAPHKECQDSPLGKIPKGWRVGELGQIADVIDCLHSKKPERQEHGLPLLQLWNIRDDGLVDMTDTYFIHDADYQLWTSRMEASPGDCVITNVGRVGAVAQVPEGVKAALGRNMTGIRCKSSFPFPTFLIESLLSEVMRNEISIKIDTGTILEALNVRNIPKLRLAIPQLEITRMFDQTCRQLRAKMEKDLAQSRTLATIRDALLPKLLSGEIRVKEVEKFVVAGR